MDEKKSLTDKSKKIKPETKNQNIENKNENEISELSPAYAFCKSLNELNNKNESGWTPIYKSIMANNKLALEELLKLGADPNIPNNLGETPLYLCIESENYDLFKLLLDNNADPNIQKRNGDTPLHLLIKKKLDNKYINEILKKNTNPNIPNKLYDQTATHLALKNKLSEEILINFWKNNADIYNKKDKYDKTPFDYAKELNDEKYIEIIIKIFGNINEPKIYILNTEKDEDNNINNLRIEKKLNFDKHTISSDNQNNDKIKSEKDNNEELKLIQNSENNITLIIKKKSVDSLSKINNETKDIDMNEDQKNLEKENIINISIQKSESNKKINESIKEIETEKTRKNIIDINLEENFSKKENDINLSKITNYSKEKESGRKEININTYTKTFNDEKNDDKNNIYYSETRNIEKDFEKLNYKLFKHIKIMSNMKKDEIRKSKKSNNINNYDHESNKNKKDDTEKDISTINNGNSFFYEEDETINESNINNKSNKENISMNNMVYHNKNHLATKEKNSKEKSYKLWPKPLYKKNIVMKQNMFRYSSPEYKFTYKCSNSNSLIRNNIPQYNNSNIYTQYRNNNIIINSHPQSTYNKFINDRISLNNTTFSSGLNNSRNNNYNNRTAINRNSITSNSISNNSIYNYNSNRNNNSYMIGDYYNTKYQINSYNIMQNNNKLIRFRDWLISCDLLCYYNTLVKNNVYNIDKYIDNIRHNKINVISFKDIEEFGIKKPGHIFRLLLKLQIDAGKIDYNLYKFITEKFSVNTMSNNNPMTTSYNELKCFGLNCCSSNNNNNYNNKKINNTINENEIIYFDIFSFLKVNNLLKFKENFIHNGFDQIDYILIQLFSRYCFNKKILNDYMHIYLDEDKNYILKILYREKKNICNTLGLQYDEDEINKILYTENRSSLNESYMNNNQNEHDDCCFIF